MPLSSGVARVVAALEAGGTNLRRSGDGWSFKCPAHDDRTASGSLGDGDRKALLFCHAGCPVEAIASALNLTLRDLFDDPRPPAGEARFDAVYRYADEDGVLLFEVVRKVGHRFFQRRPDGAGGWLWGIEGVRRVLYRLPELLDSAGRVVYVPEGEKDVDSFVARGKVATCNPGGAGKWRTEYSRALKDADHVVVVVDKDQAGYQHGRAVRDSLMAEGVEVTVVEAAEGNDATDHFLSGHGVADFVLADLGEDAALAIRRPEVEGATSVGSGPVAEVGSVVLDAVATFIARFVAFPSQAAADAVVVLGGAYPCHRRLREHSSPCTVIARETIGEEPHPRSA